MAQNAKLSDEPVVDSAARYHAGEPSQDEIAGHRSKPTMLIGLPSTEGGAATSTLHGLSSAGSSSHRHRRRRKRVTSQDRETDPSAPPADPSEYVMFLLGECDGDEEQPHHLFCELDELWNDLTGSGETEWREAARWIKFEEDVEENGERWSKPHVATLSLFSLFELRNCLATGVMMLNLEAFTMEQIADLTLNILVSEGRVPPDLRESLTELLLRRHVHLHERHRPKLSTRAASNIPLIRSLADIGKRYSSKEVDKEITSQPSLAKISTYGGMDSLDPALAAHVAAHAQASGPSEVMSGSLQGKYDLHFLKKVPPGSETSNILVGETTFLPAPITVFIRLREAVLLGDLTEVPVPTRFLFIHLGVLGNAAKYREIGRSMGVLMSDDVFHDVAYKAKSRADFLAGLDEFLSAATVLPPGEWDPSIRIEPPPSIPSQDSRKTGTSPNGNQTSGQNAATVPVTQTDSVNVMEQLTAGGDRLAGLCLAAVGSATLLTQQTEDKSKGEVAKSVGSRPELVSLEALGGTGPDDAPGGHGNDPALQRTGIIFGGLARDIRRRAPHYLSDFTDALHVQCCASFIFLYFACLTPIITFGGLLSQATGGYLGTIESILSGAVVGILYSLFSGQPLTIMGSTGPVLIFEGIVYRMCQRLEWSYLSFRLWIGFWVSMMLLIMVALDLSALVKYITRFTEESFATLIALIFIIEALKKIYAVSKYYNVNLGWSPQALPHHNCTCAPPENSTDYDVLSAMYTKHPLVDVPLITSNNTQICISAADVDEAQFVSMTIDWNNISAGRFSWDSLQFRKVCTFLNGTWTGADCVPFYVPDVFFLSCILFIFTFAIAVYLKSMRTSLFFPARVRATISDFSVVIAIALTTLTDFFLGLHTPKLEVPHEFSPTVGYRRRGWIIPAFNGNPWWSALVALGPALVATILIFMDQQITAVIVNRRENKLKKGAGYHLDLLLVSVTIMINSILGIPWFVAATVLSINHVLSLKKESEASAPGERPVYLGCREQRVTGVLIFLFIGLSVFMTSLLGRIPMAVLYGIFLFMGISSLAGVQMIQRIGLIFMPIKYQPDYSYLRHVPLRRVHMFTAIQVTCLAMLWVIKSVDAVAILFPIMVLAMCFIRKALDFIFTQDELKWLDDILPGSKAKNRPRNVYRVKSSNDVLKDDRHLLGSGVQLEQIPEKRINIAEEVAKTSIWRQLSGGNVKDTVKPQTKTKSKDSSKRGRRRKTRDSVNADGPNPKNLGVDQESVDDGGEVNTKPVLFSIDPLGRPLSMDPLAERSTPNAPWNVGNDGLGHGAVDSSHILSMPQITINPPSTHGSPEATHRNITHN
ncbi:hypothetical protein CRM22_005384 [Opisthorchis felineus]|uniref:Anion exchange protein n=1 Tax=Opisthorchis felineus TaxID=147828 RepID=A0A4S2LRB5_OPIFE|nr:hypothetical protein CRM22_005384 [Opisthorchis felineus]